MSIWDKSIELPSGTALEPIRRGGLYIIKDATDAPESGEFHVLIIQGRSQGIRRVYQIIWSVATGTEYYRTNDGTGFSAWVAREGGGSGGGPISAFAVSFNNAATGLTATNVQDALNEVEARLDIAEDDITSIDSALALLSSALNAKAAQGDVDDIDVRLTAVEDKLSTIGAGAQITDLSITRNGTTVTVVSSDGADATIPSASVDGGVGGSPAAGVMSGADKVKLDGIEENATADMSGSEITDALDAHLGGTDWRTGGGGGGYTHPNHTGDVTSVGDGATTIANNAVTNAKLADVATATIKGRISASTGDPEDLTPAQVRTLLNVADGANAYTHPNHTGDVTSVGDGATTIANNAVTNAKLADVATATIKGRISASSGDPEDLTPAQVRTLLNVADGAAADNLGNHTATQELNMGGFDIHSLRQLLGGLGAVATSGVTDWNDVTNARSGSGFTLLQGTATNGPGPTGYFHALCLEYQTKNGTGNLTQLAIPYGESSSLNNGIYIRGRYIGTWSSWRKILTETGTGNVTVSGNMTATALIGDGANITGLNASNLGTGTVPSARLSGASLVTLINTALGGTGWQGGGGGGSANFMNSHTPALSSTTQTTGNGSTDPVVSSWVKDSGIGTISSGVWTPGVAGTVLLTLGVNGSPSVSGTFTLCKNTTPILQFLDGGSSISPVMHAFTLASTDTLTLRYARGPTASGTAGGTIHRMSAIIVG